MIERRHKITRLFLFATSLFFALFGVGAQESTPPAIASGAQEITFKNGEKVQGTVLLVENGKFQFEPFGAPAFTMPVARVASVRALADEEKAVGRAIADSQKLDYAGAMALLMPLLNTTANEGALPGVREEIARRETAQTRTASAVRDKRREAFRAKFDQFVEKKIWDGALDLALADLEDYPGDPELLASAVMMQYRIHRAAAKSAIEFRSVQFDQLRKANPRSSVVHGIDIEMETAMRGQINWDKDREKFLAGALDTAQKLYDAFQLEEARGVLKKALGFSPPADVATPLKKLLAKVEAEIASGTADRRANEAERQKEMKKSLDEAATRSQLLTEKQSKNIENRIQKKAGAAARHRP